MSKALESFEVKIGSACNGEEALKKIEEKDNGVILLDLKLPGCLLYDTVGKSLRFLMKRSQG